MHDEVDLLGHFRRYWISSAIAALLIIGAIGSSGHALASALGSFAIAMLILAMWPVVKSSWKAGIKWPSLLFLVIFVFVTNTASKFEASTPGVSRTAVAATVASEPEVERKPTPPLLLGSFNCAHSYGFSITEGAVTNVSAKPIERLMAVVSMEDGNGNFISSSSAMVEYQPLLPNQRSPFKVMVPHNPRMSTCRISFKQMFGGAVPYSRD